MMIFIIAIAIFASSFFLLGQNQLDFDNLSSVESASLPYSHATSSVKYIFELTLGNFDSD